MAGDAGSTTRETIEERIDGGDPVGPAPSRADERLSIGGGRHDEAVTTASSLLQRRHGSAVMSVAGIKRRDDPDCAVQAVGAPTPSVCDHPTPKRPP